ncbi:MAG: adenylyltransferase/cytidyltransferase family protein [Candidatus Andersenbacteria bacterium]|nr:adenylyltransferase/cytidyltransferase family protein [Candidatus Andersenbacteria bacterium]
MKKIVVFGTFDPLHPGHEFLFREAKKMGDYLIVVVSRDATISIEKQRSHHISEQERLQAVQENPDVDEAVLGDEDPRSYALLKNLDFDILALGYDQKPSDEDVWAILGTIGKPNVKVVRLPAHKPEQYKSSLIRTS